jgi:hypothetical protein
MIAERLRRTRAIFAVSLVLLPCVARADLAADVRNAVVALGNTSYAWETTVRQKFAGESTEPRLDLNGPLEIKGRIDPDTFTEITLMPSKQALAVPVTAISRAGDVVGKTPLGWMRRTEMRSVPPPDRMVDFEGTQVRLSHALSVALRATAMPKLTDDLLDLLDDLKSYKETSGLVMAEMRDAAIEKLWGDPQAKRAPEVLGTVIFKLSEQGVTEYHIVLAIGFPNARTKKTAWSMQQWSTRIRGIGSTTVEPPAAAVTKLEEQ